MAVQAGLSRRRTVTWAAADGRSRAVRRRHRQPVSLGKSGPLRPLRETVAAQVPTSVTLAGLAYQLIHAVGLSDTAVLQDPTRDEANTRMNTFGSSSP